MKHYGRFAKKVEYEALQLLHSRSMFSDGGVYSTVHVETVFRLRDVAN